MSRDLTRPVQRGLLVHDERVTLDRDDAAHTWVDMGPRPGVPEDQGDPRSLLVLKASGEQSADASLQVQAIRAGFAGDRRRAAGYVYRDARDDDWRGWDVPHTITGWEWLRRAGSPSTAFLHQAHMLRLQDGRVLLVARDAAFSPPVVTVRRYDPATGEWTSLTTVAPPSSPLVGAEEEALLAQAWPCLVQLPGGRVQLYAWVGDGSTYEQLSMWYSDDQGETWTRGARWCLAEELDPSVATLSGKARVAYSPSGQMAIVATVTDVGTAVVGIRQWASDDLGTRFLMVSDEPPVGDGPELLPRSDGAWRVFWRNEFGAISRADLASAWTPIDDNNTGSSVFAVGPHEDLCVWPDEGGVWYGAATRDLTNISASRMGVARSADEGLTWELLAEPWPVGGASGQMPYEATAAMTCGQTVMACRFVDEATDLDTASLLLLYLGGHSTVTLPSGSRSRAEEDQATWQFIWLPIDPPDAWTGWALTTSGVTSGTMVEGGMEASATGGHRTYTLSGLDTGAGYETVALVEVALGLADETGRVTIRAWNGSSAAGYGATISMFPGGLELQDASTGGTLGTPVGVDFKEDAWQFLLAVGNGRARCWYRQVPTPGEPEREWIAGPFGSPSLVTGSAVLGTVRLRVEAGAAETAAATWRFAGAVGLAAALGLAGGPDYPEDLFPRSFAGLPQRLPGGVRLAATDGPALDGDSWHVDPRFEFGVALMDPVAYPSPRRVARTEVTGPQVVYSLTGLAGSSTLLDTTSWAVGIYGASTCDVQLHGWDGTQWVALTSGSSWVEGLAYQRVGDAIRPDPSEVDPATDPLYVERDMLRGAVIDLGGGQLRRIRTNTEGWWGTGPGRPPVLYLDPDYLDGTEPESGTCAIGPGERGQVIVVHGLDSYEKLRVAFGAGWGDVVQVGTVVVGPVLLWGQEYSYGRVQSTAPNVTLTTARGGARHARREGPARRSVEFGWSEGVLERDLWTGTAPDYVCGQMGGDPVAVARDVGSMLAGLIEQIDGPRVPVVYLPAVPSEAAEVRLLWPSQHMYGRIVSDIRRETVIGDERRDELVRVASVVIEEEV